MNRARMLTTLALTAAVTAVPAPAHAAPQEFRIEVRPGTNGGATATLSDTILPSNRYLLTLTATGAGACGFPGPTVQIADTDVQGSTNPVSATVSGACTLYNGTVVYTVTWTGLPGSSGQFPVHCTWVLGTQQCSVSTVTLAVP